MTVPIKIISHYNIKRFMNASKKKLNVSAVVPEDVAHSVTLKARLRNYILGCVPTVYHEEHGYFKKVAIQIFRDHMYINLFRTNDDPSIFVSSMEAFKVLSLLTLSMFILVILYNAQYPSNDNTCSSLYTSSDCLTRKAFRNRNYCKWMDDECLFNDSEFSMSVVLFLAWFELFIVAPLGSLIIVIFDMVILAPTQVVVQEQLKMNHTTSFARRMSTIGNGISNGISNGMRRLSTVGSQLRRLSMSMQVADIDMKKRVQSVRKTILVNNDLVETRRNVVSLLSYTNHHRHRQHQVEVTDANDIDIAQALYQKSVACIKEYRHQLNDIDRGTFDQYWDQYFDDAESSKSDNIINTEDEQLTTSIVNDNTTATSRYDKFSKSLYEEILLVQEKSSEIYTNIKNSPSHIIGII